MAKKPPSLYENVGTVAKLFAEGIEATPGELGRVGLAATREGGELLGTKSSGTDFKDSDFIDVEDCPALGESEVEVDVGPDINLGAVSDETEGDTLPDKVIWSFGASALYTPLADIVAEAPAA